MFMTVRLLAACLFLLFIGFTSAFASEDRRVALVIGNSAYKNVVALPNPVNDARAMSAALGRLGFDVTLLTNVSKVDFDQGLADFSEKASNADLALVFYAGHGIEMGGVNYLIPVDAKLKTDLRVPFETVSLNSVLGAVSAAKKLRMVLLDACRNNPFAEKMTRSLGANRSIGRGLADLAAGPNELISYSALAGKEASDGESGHSPYTEALLANIEKPGIEVGKLFRIVADEVQAKTNGEQVPYESARLPATDIFLRDPDVQPQIEGEVVNATNDSDARADWEIAQKSGKVDVLRAFVETHGDAKMYRLLAEEQIAILERADKPGSLVEAPVEAAIPDKFESAPVTECDRLATVPNDRQAISRLLGVEFAKIQAKKALQECKKSLDAYPSEARFLFLYGRALYRNDRAEEAMQYYKRAAALNYGMANNGIAMLYLKGVGTVRSGQEAFKWFQKAASLNVSTSMYSLGYMYQKGEFVAKDERKAAEWMVRALQLGDTLTFGELFVRNNNWPTSFRREIQKELARIGSYDGPVNGVLGPSSRSAAEKIMKAKLGDIDANKAN